MLIVDLAHDIRDHTRVTAEAMRKLKAECRWALSGTPIQNNLSDIASLYQFLRVAPYTDEPALVKKHIKRLFEDKDLEAISKAKRLIRCIMLRRSLQAVTLPQRKDLVHYLDFSMEEAQVYTQSKSRATALLDETGGNISPLHIFSWINTLRMICNLGTHAKLPEYHTGAFTRKWSVHAAQDMFNTLISTGAATCSSCSTDLATATTEVADREVANRDVSDADTQPQLASCGYLICRPCIEKQGVCTHCGTHSPAHELQSVSTLSSSLSIEVSDSMTATTPTKITALLQDLDQHLADEKW